MNRLGPAMRAPRAIYQTETADERAVRMAAESAARERRRGEWATDNSMRRGEVGVGCRGAYGVRIEEEFLMLHGCDK